MLGRKKKEDELSKEDISNIKSFFAGLRFDERKYTLEPAFSTRKQFLKAINSWIGKDWWAIERIEISSSGIVRVIKAFKLSEMNEVRVTTHKNGNREIER